MLAKKHKILSFFLACTSLLWSETIRIPGVDEVISTGSRIHLFNFSNWTRKTIYLQQAKKEKPTPKATAWQKLIKPDYKFSPRQVLAGQSNNFLVLEDGGERIWQLDSGFQTLSSITVPVEFKGAQLEGFKLSYSRDQKFNFIHSQRGLVLQFVEQGGKLKLHRKIKIPVLAGQCFPVSWPGKNSLSNFPYLCAGKNKLQLYTLFFTGGKFLSLADYASLPQKDEWKSMRPRVVLQKKSSIVYMYTLNHQKFCYSSELSEFYSCPENLNQ